MAIASVKDLLKLAAKKAGYTIRNTRGQAFGIDVWCDIQRLSRACNRPVDVVFDVGANSGATTKHLRGAFPSSVVYAFEPHPITFAELKSNTKALERVNLVPVALSDRKGFSTFYDYGGSGHVDSLSPDARFAKRFNLRADELQVETTTVDLFCEEAGVQRISVLKTDTEGNDLAVFIGAERMLRARSIEFVYFEFNDVQAKPGTSGGSFNEIGRYLSDFGFHFVATYTDYVLTEGEFFVVANALLARGKN